MKEWTSHSCSIHGFSDQSDVADAHFLLSVTLTPFLSFSVDFVFGCRRFSVVLTHKRVNYTDFLKLLVLITSKGKNPDCADSVLLSAIPAFFLATASSSFAKILYLCNVHRLKQ